MEVIKKRDGSIWSKQNQEKQGGFPVKKSRNFPKTECGLRHRKQYDEIIASSSVFFGFSQSDFSPHSFLHNHQT
jgi:hypothetical protein